MSITLGFGKQFSPILFDSSTLKVMELIRSLNWITGKIVQISKLTVYVTDSSFLDRYRRISRFGRDTIRRFANNASEMKKLGARDFEDLLLCAIPAFEGLFDIDEDNKLVGKLLFKMTEWHAFAKLRMHTDDKIEHLETLTAELGIIMRKFQRVTCSRTPTFELPRERAARERRQAEQNKASNQRRSTSTGRKRKGLNLNVYKWHALGDYARFIKLFGPTDIYSTQIVCIIIYIISAY